MIVTLKNVSKEDLVQLIRITQYLMEENKRLKQENKELKSLLKSVSGIIFIDGEET